MTNGYPKRTIERGMNRPITVPSGTLPDAATAMQDWFQPLQFTTITKGALGFEVIETGVVTEFRGVVMPFQPRQLMLRPEGQRAWTWMLMYSERVFPLQVDDLMMFLGKQTRVMARKDYGLFGYLETHLVQDFTGSDPQT